MRWRLSGVLVAALLVAFGVGAAPASAEPPVNDGVAGAVVVTGLPYSSTFDVSDATVDGDDAAIDSRCGLPQATHSVWFSFTPADATVIRGWARAGASGDLRMNVGVVVGGSGSVQPLTCSLDSIYVRTADLAAGTRYLIRVSLTDAVLPAGTSGDLTEALSEQVLATLGSL